MPRTLADELRAHLKNSDLNLSELQRATGVDRLCLRRFLAGKGNPRMDSVEKLARYFHLVLKSTKPKPIN